MQTYSCVDLRTLLLGEGRGDASRWGGEKNGREGKGGCVP